MFGPSKVVVVRSVRVVLVQGEQKKLPPPHRIDPQLQKPRSCHCGAERIREPAPPEAPLLGLFKYLESRHALSRRRRFYCTTSTSISWAREWKGKMGGGFFIVRQKCLLADGRKKELSSSTFQCRRFPATSKLEIFAARGSVKEASYLSIEKRNPFQI